jgi:hypothetical protein
MLGGLGVDRANAGHHEINEGGGATDAPRKAMHGLLDTIREVESQIRGR